MNKYTISNDGHLPTPMEVRRGKEEFRKLQKEFPENYPYNKVLMTFSDVNYERSWTFSEHITEE